MKKYTVTNHAVTSEGGGERGGGGGGGGAAGKGVARVKIIARNSDNVAVAD